MDARVRGGGNLGLHGGAALGTMLKSLNCGPKDIGMFGGI